ncbi:MAG: phosphate acyltransferase PlsX [Lachnospiraceae bacterium]|nr:phosphate acyltransferase PlsX [Lachnospiraceae bacterium]
MAETVRVVVDAMGGDNAPGEIVKGAVMAANSRKDIQVILTGREELIRPEMDKYTYDAGQVEVVHCEDVIETAEPPVHAISRKKQSSMVVGMNMVKRGEADAIVSAGNSGAILVGGQTVVGRIKGVERPAMAPLIPTENGVALLLDAGGNVDARPTHLVQFAQMGYVYMENVIGVRNPRVAILNIGAEEEKGNALVKETYPLLKACPGINFVGSIEAREIPHGGADVIVCEAFAGNIVLKLYEGVASTLISKVKESMMSSLRTKIGALLIKPALKQTLKSFDASEYGGAPLLGCRGLVVKTHGSAKATDVRNSVIQCVTFKQQGINEKIAEHISGKDGKND